MTIPSSPVPYFTPTVGLQSGSDLQKMADQLYNTQGGITAQADASKANATRITSPNALVTVVAGAADSVLLPPGYIGLEVFLFNAGANSMQVFGSGSDTINDVATATGVAHGNGLGGIYRCMKYDPVTKIAGWYRTLSA